MDRQRAAARANGRTVTPSPRSLAYRTDLALLRHSGSVVSSGDGCLAIATPDNPGFYWGNFLLLPEAPGEEIADAWIACFAGTFPAARHVALGVDTVDGAIGDLDALAGRGFHVEASAVMTAHEVHAPRSTCAEAELRPLVSDADWAASAELRLHCDAEDGDEPVDEFHERFVAARTAANRTLVEGGAGRWFGAFLDGRLVAQLGLVDAGGGLARFQSVETDPGYRRRGLAGSLVHLAARWGLDEAGADTLVMVADPGYHAITLYEQVGFTRTETQLQAHRPPSP